eukprot:GHVT01061754.1.p1 GENE.GHVT01061754.1~~GHVT01061754.1.p1  ORF type:complete len:178 (-),score=11.52 GHVT01061754.1:205-738(-)
MASTTPGGRRKEEEDQRLSFSVVWTGLPGLTTIVPVIGHLGICTSQGIVHDFAGDNFVNVGCLSFGRPLKVWRLAPHNLPGLQSSETIEELWDRGIERADDQFNLRPHNIFTNNCHHHVAAALNEVRYLGKEKWTQVDVWWHCMIHGHYLSWGSVAQAWGPFVVLIFILLAVTLLTR